MRGGPFLFPLGRGQAFARVCVVGACGHFCVASYLAHEAKRENRELITVRFLGS